MAIEIVSRLVQGNRILQMVDAIGEEMGPRGVAKYRDAVVAHAQNKIPFSTVKGLLQRSVNYPHRIEAKLNAKIAENGRNIVDGWVRLASQGTFTLDDAFAEIEARKATSDTFHQFYNNNTKSLEALADHIEATGPEPENRDLPFSTEEEYTEVEL